jgi:hypothetical protein
VAVNWSSGETRGRTRGRVADQFAQVVLRATPASTAPCPTSAGGPARRTQARLEAAAAQEKRRLRREVGSRVSAHHGPGEATRSVKHDLETALKTSEGKVREHLQVMDSALKEHESKLNEQLSSLSLQLGQLSGSVADIPTSSPSPIPEAQQNAQDKMHENWERIRDRLEAIAANSQIDGRTRARYGRIDRRRYGDLVNALDNDGRLGADAIFYRDAVELWQKFRNRRATPSAGEVQTMQDLANRLTGPVTP